MENEPAFLAGPPRVSLNAADGSREGIEVIDHIRSGQRTAEQADLDHRRWGLLVAALTCFERAALPVADVPLVRHTLHGELDILGAQARHDRGL
jgi:hypothetical protein